MRLCDRYIGKQVLIGTLYAVLILSMVLVLGNLFKQIRPLLVDQRAPLGLVLRFVLNVLPFSLMYTIPWGFLSAVLLVFGRMSGDQEINSFRSAGMSLLRIAAPVFVIGAILSGFCLWLNINVVPLAKASITDMIYEQVKRDPRSLLDPGIVQSRFQNQKVFVERRDGDSLAGFHLYQVASEITEDDQDEIPQAYIHAGKVSLVVDEEKKQLRLKLTDAYIETYQTDAPPQLAFAQEAEPWLFDFGSTQTRKARSSAMTNNEIEDYLEQNPELDIKQRTRFRAEITKRYSFSLACLSFACIAVPLGLKSRRRDSSGGLVISLLIGTGYFLFTVLADQVRADADASLILWAPNIFCIALGLFLFRKARFR